VTAQTGASRHTGGHGRFAAAWRAAAPDRPLMALMLVSSMASFAALGALSLFARDELGASDTMVTVTFVVVALAGTAVMLVTGQVSDRRGSGLCSLRRVSAG
jgi:MFS transporter, SET family, sugar efflux transporter